MIISQSKKIRKGHNMKNEAAKTETNKRLHVNKAAWLKLMAMAEEMGVDTDTEIIAGMVKKLEACRREREEMIALRKSTKEKIARLRAIDVIDSKMDDVDFIDTAVESFSQANRGAIDAAIGRIKKEFGIENGAESA